MTSEYLEQLRGLNDEEWNAFVERERRYFQHYRPETQAVTRPVYNTAQQPQPRVTDTNSTPSIADRRAAIQDQQTRLRENQNHQNEQQHGDISQSR